MELLGAWSWEKLEVVSGQHKIEFGDYLMEQKSWSGGPLRTQDKCDIGYICFPPPHTQIHDTGVWVAS